MLRAVQGRRYYGRVRPFLSWEAVKSGCAESLNVTDDVRGSRLMWSSRLFWKAFTAFVGLIILSAGVFGLLVTSGQHNQVESQFINRLRVSAMMLGRVVEDDLSSGEVEHLQERIKELGKQTETRLTVIDFEGFVLADSEKDSAREVAAMDDHRNRQELVAALREGYGQSDRYSKSMRTNFVYYAIRVDGEDGKPIGFARASLPDERLQQHFDRMRRLVWLFASMVTVVAIIGSYGLVARIVYPLMTVTRAAERIADGKFDRPIEIANRDELGTLAKSFNRMSRQLSSRITQLRERGDQLAAVLGGMTEGVIAVDDRTRILFANNSAGRQLDFNASKVKGRPLLTTIRHETLHQSVRRAISTGRPVTAEVELHGPTIGNLTVHATPLPGEPCPGVVLVLNDMTEIRRLESLRQEFVANVSHELKTPLSSIKAYAETLREGAIYDERHNTLFVQRIEDQADRLHRLILDLLALARIEAGQKTYEIDDVEVYPVVEACLEHHATSAEAKSIELTTNSPLTPVLVRTDEEALRQILDNLVNNGIKYTSEGGRVSVGWRVDEDDALIEVVDTGIGIAPEDQARLFERFYRVDKARSRELGGTGLGLSIVKHLAQFFGGSVGVHSTPGEGSTFKVRLPLA